MEREAGWCLEPSCLATTVVRCCRTRALTLSVLCKAGVPVRLLTLEQQLCSACGALTGPSECLVNISPRPSGSPAVCPWSGVWERYRPKAPRNMGEGEGREGSLHCS